MTETRSNRVVYCDRCNRAIVGGRYFVDCTGARPHRFADVFSPHARVVLL